MVALVSAAVMVGVDDAYDTQEFGAAGASMWGPHVLDVYADPWLQIGPLYLLLVGALYRVAGAVHLDGELLTSMVLGGALAWATVRTAGRVARTHARDALVAQWVVGGVVVGGGFLVAAVDWGHFEEVLITVLLLEGALLAPRRPVLAGALLGLAAGLKQWAPTAAPGVVLRGRGLHRALLVASVGAAVTVASYGPFLLWGDVRTFEFQWPIKANTLFARAGEVTGLDDWHLRVIQAAVVLVAGTVVAWLTRRRGNLAVPLIVAVAVRILLDPLRVPYYDGALVVLVLVWLWCTDAPVRRRTAAFVTACLPLVMLYPRLFGARQLDWGASNVLLAVCVVVPVALELKAARADELVDVRPRGARVAARDDEGAVSPRTEPAVGVGGR